ncbi:MAG: hypothetical protein CMP47_15340 [Rickettsiales bacterium]|nr:hypothetical protein [Rickettsiales bacterium]
MNALARGARREPDLNAGMGDFDRRVRVESGLKSLGFLVGAWEGFFGGGGLRTGLDMPRLTLCWRRVALAWPEARNVEDAFMFAARSVVDTNRGKILAEMEVPRLFARRIALQNLGDASEREQ